MNETVKEEMIARSEGINQALEQRGAGFQVTYSSNFKNNMMCDSYNLVTEDDSVSPVVYYSEEWWSDDDREVADYLMRIKQTVPDQEMDIASYLQLEYVSENALPRLYGENNQANMQADDRAYVKFLDMLIGFYVPIRNLSSKDSLASIPVTNALLERIELTENELLEIAIGNAAKESRIADMYTLLGDVLGIPGDVLKEEKPDPMIIVSNRSGVNGAASILCKEVQEKVADILGGEYNILPSSIHECICCPLTDTDRLHSMVKKVNANEVPETERLTNSVYCYRKGAIEQLA